jgi:hypothetical protein
MSAPQYEEKPVDDSHVGVHNVEGQDYSKVCIDGLFGPGRVTRRETDYRSFRRSLTGGRSSLV